MTSANQSPRPVRPKGAALVLIFTASQAAYNFPAWWKRAKMTLVDGGSSGATVTTASGAIASGGSGGDSGINWIDITPDTPYSITAGAGATGAGAGTTLPSVAGSLSSVTPRGMSQITTSNSQLKVVGASGTGQLGANQVGLGGGTLFATYTNSSSHLYGGGGAGAPADAAARPGANGVVIFEYLEA